MKKYCIIKVGDNMKKCVFRIIIIIVIINICMNLSMFFINKSMALDDVLENPAAYAPGYDAYEHELKIKFDKILGVISVVGVVVSVATLMLIGIKYMVGSVEQKAKYKEILVPWLLGAGLVFSASTLPNFIYNITGSEHVHDYSGAYVATAGDKHVHKCLTCDTNKEVPSSIEVYSFDRSKHGLKCSVCGGFISGTSNHTYKNGKCTVCGFVAKEFTFGAEIEEKPSLGGIKVEEIR